MTKYFTSDLHFGHCGVIEYCNRPYKDVEEMNKGLITIWNATVKEGDLVYVIGDFSLNKKYSKEILPLLNGDKVLISGNHDQCFKFDPKNDTKDAIEGAKRRYDKAVNEYLSHGWKSIHQELSITLSSGDMVLLSHLPYKPKGEEFDRRYLNHRPIDNGLTLLHGHQHAKYRKYYNQIDVGIDGDMKLWSEEEIIGMMNNPADIIYTPISRWYKEQNELKGKEV